MDTPKMRLQFEQLTGKTVAVKIVTEKSVATLGYLRDGNFTIHWNCALAAQCDDTAQVEFTLPVKLLEEIAQHARTEN